MLDNSCLLFTNSMWSGSKHDSSKVPVVLAGGLGGTLANRPRARLHRPGRRQPQALQHVPVDHGPHGRQARPLRRRRHPPRRSLSRVALRGFSAGTWETAPADDPRPRAGRRPEQGHHDVPHLGRVADGVVEFAGNHGAGLPVAPLGVANQGGADAIAHCLGGLRRLAVVG